jgi:predicted membrane protein DUF2207
MSPFAKDAWLLSAPAALFVYYFIAWFRHGRDPKPGPLVIRYEPPAGLSAAAVRYILTTGTDGRSFAAVIAELASRSCIRVEPQDGKYKLSLLMSDRATRESLAPEEKDLLATLFEDGPTIEFTPSFDQRETAETSRYITHIHQQLAKRLNGLYFTRQTGVIALGVLGTLVISVLFAAIGSGRGDLLNSVFFTVWVLFAGLIIGLLFEVSFVPACRNAIRGRKGISSLIPGFLAIAVFLGAIAFLLREVYRYCSPALSFMILAFLLVHLGWGPCLKQITPLGRKTLDEIAGFRAFLESVERDRLEKLHPPDEATQSLDPYISYAIALEVREAWGDHLASTFVASTVCT